MKIIGGKFKGRNIFAPKTGTTRPTQGALREAVFNICQSEIVDAYFLDLFAGSGAVGFEALSRGSAHITLVEKNKTALHTIRKNIELFNVAEQTTLLPLDANLAIEKMTKPFDIIYVDPPYNLKVAPFIHHLLEKQILKREGSLFVEVLYSHKSQDLVIKSLKAKSVRKFGSAALYHFCF